MPKNKPTTAPTTPPTLGTMYTRLGATLDALLDQKLSPEHGNAIANVAEKIHQFAKLELQAIDIALSNEREITPSGFLPEIEPEDRSNRPPRRLLDR